MSWCRDQESNQGHTDFQSVALPTELSRRKERLHYAKGLALVKDNFRDAGPPVKTLQGRKTPKPGEGQRPVTQDIKKPLYQAS